MDTAMHRGTEQRLEECSQGPRDDRQQPQEPQAGPQIDSPEPPVGAWPATSWSHISGLQTVRECIPAVLSCPAYDFVHGRKMIH